VTNTVSQHAQVALAIARLGLSMFLLAGSTIPAEVAQSPDSRRAAAGSQTASIRINLTVQEALYSGVAGLPRQQEPVTVGLPLPDAAGIRNISELGMEGTSAGQFRVLGRWPSGNIEWVLVDTLADVDAGKINNSVSLTNGSGNFGGPNLASDNGLSITISTGAANFTVRKSSFDLLDEVVVNDRVLVKQGTSAGLAVEGPLPGNTVCPCTTLYASSNDKSSTAVIEENGPVRAVIRATGQLKDTSGHAYVRYTVRLHFYKGKTRTKAVVSLQNADYGPSNSFASAYKGFRSFEARLSANLGGGRRFRFGGAHSDVSGSLLDTEDAYLYQAYSDHLEFPQWASPDTRTNYAPRSYIKRTLSEQRGSRRSWTYAQEGCTVLHNNESLAKNSRSESCAGWTDLTDSSGAGIEIGVYEIAAYWPKSLEFLKGGSDVRVGIWPDQSLFGAGGQDYYQSWPQYSIHTIYFNFHAAALSDPAGEFGRSQYPLLARAAVAYYNEAKALLYPIVDPQSEDRYFQSLGLACCAKDIAAPHAYRTYAWRAAGSPNQAEMRWANLMFWLQRGFAARYLDASHFYMFQAEQVLPRSDYDGERPFNWRDRPDSDLDSYGLPDRIKSLNANIDCDPGVLQCGRNWIDNAHAHWYGMIDYYFLTGDETIKDAIQDGASDIYGNPKVLVAKNGTYWSSRNIGEALMSDARLALFYRATGDSLSENRALLAGTQVLEKQIWPELELSGFGNASQGVSRTRGVHYGCCPKVNRMATPFMHGILGEGLWEFLEAEGPQWPRRQLTLDLAYGMAAWSLNEAWRTKNNAKGCRNGSGLTYLIFLDRPNASLDPSCVHTVWFNFHNYAKYTGDPRLWEDKFAEYLKHINGNGVFYGEIGTIFEGAVMGIVLNPEPLTLSTVALRVEKEGSGTYHLTWTEPRGTRSYRLKYADKNIVEWLGFDPVINKFAIPPDSNVPWFAASEVAKPPTPGSAGTHTFDVTGLDPGVEWHFALKAFVQAKHQGQ